MTLSSKKFFLKGGFALLLALGVFAFASCNNGGDDDDDATEQTTQTVTDSATSGTVSSSAVTTDSGSSSSSSTSTDLSAFSTPTLSELAGKTYKYTSVSDSDSYSEYYYTFTATGVTREKYKYTNKDGSVSCRKSSDKYVCTYENGVLTEKELKNGEVRHTESILVRKYDGTLYLINSDLTLARTSGSGLYATFSLEWTQNEGKEDEVTSSISITLSSDKSVTYKDIGNSTSGDMTYTDIGTGTFTVKDNLIISANIHFVDSTTTTSSRYGTETETDEYDEASTMIYDGANLLFADVLTATTTLPTVTE